MSLRATPDPSLADERNHPMIRMAYKGLLKDISNKCVNDFDYVTAVAGYEGTGKSELSVRMARDLDDDVEEHPERHIFWDSERLVEAVWGMPPSAIVLDEAGLDLFNRDATSKQNKKFVKLLMVCRQQRHALILVIPSLMTLDRYARVHRTRLYVLVYTRNVHGMEERGYARFRVPVRSEWEPEPFWTSQMTLRFGPLPKSLSERYKALKLEHSKARSLMDNQGSEQKLKIDDAKIRELLSIRDRFTGKQKLSNVEIADIAGCSKAHVGDVKRAMRCEPQEQYQS